jgi:hypothetical protein
MHSLKVASTLLTVSAIAVAGAGYMMDPPASPLDATRSASSVPSTQTSKGVGAMIRDARTKSNEKNLETRDAAGKGSEISDDEYVRLHRDALGKMSGREPNVSSEAGVERHNSRRM